MNKKNLSIGFLLLFSSILLFHNNYSLNKDITIYEPILSINEPVTLSKETYLAILEIPKISLKKALYNLKSSNNNVNKNIKVLYESDMPDVLNGNFILASHSGNSKISYFKNIYKLKKGDISYVYYNNKKYAYKVTNIYKVEKNGSVEIIRNNNISCLTMITCDKKDKTKQIVIISEQIKNP